MVSPSICLAPDDAVWSRSITEEELARRIKTLAGDKADGLLATFKQHYPAASPTDRLLFMTTGSNFEVRSMMLGERKAARGKASVWMYRFDWETPAYDGRLKSPHSMEVPFVFDTLSVIGEKHNKPHAQDLADQDGRRLGLVGRRMTDDRFARFGCSDFRDAHGCLVRFLLRVPRGFSSGCRCATPGGRR